MQKEIRAALLFGLVEVVEELGFHLVSFDRPGYGESDPHPKRTPESIALDIEELADHLEFGSRFYVMGFSMGGQVVWGCLKYIPHRLAGAALIAPVVNYWWPGFPANLSTEAYYLQLPQDQWTLRVAHHAPWLTYWWNTQKWFPASAVAARKPEVFSRQDLELLSMVADGRMNMPQTMQQGKFETIHRDMMVGFGKWEFDPMDLENPFPDNEGTVHLWQGDEDKMSEGKFQVDTPIKESNDEVVEAANERHALYEISESTLFWLLKKVAVVLFLGLVAWAYQATQPPPQKTSGSPGGPPITASRIKPRDGRHGLQGA
ncbi:hypothetical protein D5086_020965 [Populus alba]|uniref:Uncharacterized protein n=1 Tax=Populus alba TaxID=43335 RepID=A0ACC4BM44_POPAL